MLRREGRGPGREGACGTWPVATASPRLLWAALGGRERAGTVSAAPAVSFWGKGGLGTGVGRCSRGAAERFAPFGENMKGRIPGNLVCDFVLSAAT